MAVAPSSEALTELNKALDVNKSSSLAHYRIADIFFTQRNYQSAANEFREALNGDGIRGYRQSAPPSSLEARDTRGLRYK